MRETSLTETENDVDLLKKPGCDGFGSWRDSESELSMETTESIVGLLLGFS